jgi:serine/threonine protein kinase
VLYGFADQNYLIDFDSAFYVKDLLTSARGTRPFVAPEVYMGQLTTAMDVWCWGMFVFDTFFCFYREMMQNPDLLSAIAEKQNRCTPSYPIVELLFDLIWKCLEVDPAKRITAEQARKHPFFYAMEHIKPSLITLYVLGSHLQLDREDFSKLTDEELSVTLPPTVPTPTTVQSKSRANRTPLKNITNAVHVK